MGYELTFSALDERQKTDHIEISQKIIAIDAELVKISEERAEAEANWRKKENFLNTEKGKLQHALGALRTATLTEVK